MNKPLALQVGLQYSAKGYVEESAMPVEVGQPRKYRFTYLELPVTVAAALGLRHGFALRAGAGLVPALTLAARDGNSDIENQVGAWDLGFRASVGFSLPVAWGALEIESAYTMGMVSLAPPFPEKHRSLAVTLGTAVRL
jgi:hypothetical protein